MKHAMRALVLSCLLIALVIPFAVVAQEEEETPLPDTIILNEIELNPQGMDADKEWVELLNVSDAPVDLLGWMITATYRVVELIPICEESVTVPPGGRYIFAYPGLRLRNEDGAVIQLVNPDGIVVDQTSPLDDTLDNDLTWQRYPDGGDPLFPDMWWFLPASRNASNN